VSPAAQRLLAQPISDTTFYVLATPAILLGVAALFFVLAIVY